MVSIKNQIGQSIVEALIALSAGVTIIAAIAIAVINSISNADYAKNQNLATNYAQQGMEIVNVLQKSNWNTFVTLSGTYCLDKESTNLSSAIECDKNVDEFVRTVLITKNTADCTTGSRVNVKVAWEDGKCKDEDNPYCHDVELISCIEGIHVIPSP